MRKLAFSVFASLIIFSLSSGLVCAETQSQLNLDINLTKNDVPGADSSPSSSATEGGLSGGAIVGISGGALAGATLLGAAGSAIAPGLLAGLTKEQIIGAAAPVTPSPLTKGQIATIYNNKEANQYLLKAIKKSFPQFPNTKTVAVDDSLISPNAYSVVYFNVPASMNGVKVRIIRAGQPFGENNLQPDLDFRLFVNADEKYLDNIFNTQRYKSLFDNKKEVALLPKERVYQEGIYIKEGMINTVGQSQVTAALVTTYTPQAAASDIKYAYLIEVK